MNYQISKHTKEMIESALTELSVLVAAIPADLLDPQMVFKQAVALQNDQYCSIALENATIIDDWQDLESDVHNPKAIGR